MNPHGLDAARTLRDEADVTQSPQVRLLLLVMALETVVIAERRATARPARPLRPQRPLRSRVAEVAAVAGADPGSGIDPGLARSAVRAAYRARDLAFGLALRGLPDHLLDPLVADLDRVVRAVLDVLGAGGERYRGSAAGAVPVIG